jgi:hypothetical protein
MLSRLSACYGGVTFFSTIELHEWPKSAVSALKKSGLLTQATPENSVTCDGCEQQCQMPIEIVSRGARLAAFVVCDKRPDINRVYLPLEGLERWQTSGEAVAAFLAATLGINRPPSVAMQSNRWNVGRLKSERVDSVALTIADGLTIEVAGHPVPVDEVLSLKGGRLVLDKQTMNACVDNPASVRPGRVDLAARVAALDAAIEENRKLGVAAPVKAALATAGISRQRAHDMRSALRKRKASTLT